VHRSLAKRTPGCHPLPKNAIFHIQTQNDPANRQPNTQQLDQNTSYGRCRKPKFIKKLMQLLDQYPYKPSPPDAAIPNINPVK
jgi:hypothetical protein